MPFGQSEDVSDVEPHGVGPLEFIDTTYGPARPQQSGPTEALKKGAPKGFKSVWSRLQQNARSWRPPRRHMNGAPPPQPVEVYAGRMNENVAGGSQASRVSSDEVGTPVVYRSSTSDEELPDPYGNMNIVVRYLCFCTCIRSR
ncbi:hypothetical protein HYDPIDRAFT_108241 [Hydnomerulius pinastri MD-312]|nr:hypothetical protein HYDPIDRAFT_108241 [Hydnomerulius pinastri MD-312]